MEWPEEAVRKSVSITEMEALQKNVIDLIAKNDDELLAKIEGKQVEVMPEQKHCIPKMQRLKTLK